MKYNKVTKLVKKNAYFHDLKLFKNPYNIIYSKISEIYNNKYFVITMQIFKKKFLRIKLK